MYDQPRHEVEWKPLLRYLHLDKLTAFIILDVNTPDMTAIRMSAVTIGISILHS